MIVCYKDDDIDFLIGFSCEFFTMKLAVEGIYLPVLTRQFSLVQNVGDLVHVPAIVETFGLVKVVYAFRFLLAFANLSFILGGASKAQRKNQ